jgi:hypothetical protein
MSVNYSMYIEENIMHSSQIELSEKRRKQVRVIKSDTNKQITSAIILFDASGKIGTFSLLLYEVFVQMLHEMAGVLLFPANAAFSLISACLAWRQAQLDQNKNYTFHKFFIEALSAIAICTAVVGGFVATTLFASIIPIIMTVVTGVKALFHGALAAYYYGKAYYAEENDDKEKYSALAGNHFKTATALVLATIAIAGVMILAKPFYAFIGIGSGILAMGFAAHNFYKLHYKKKKEKETLSSTFPPKREEKKEVPESKK